MRIEHNATIQEVFKLRKEKQNLSKALKFYSEGRHFDIIDGRTRIIDTGACAEDALMGT